MTVATTSPKRRRDASPKVLKKRRQKLWRDKRKAVFEATLKLLESMPEDAPLIIRGRDWKGDA